MSLIPHHWTPQQAAAVSDFLETALGELWQRYDLHIINVMLPDQTELNHNKQPEPRSVADSSPR